MYGRMTVKSPNGYQAHVAQKQKLSSLHDNDLINTACVCAVHVYNIYVLYNISYTYNIDYWKTNTFRGIAIIS